MPRGLKVCGETMECVGVRMKRETRCKNLKKCLNTFFSSCGKASSQGQQKERNRHKKTTEVPVLKENKAIGKNVECYRLEISPMKAFESLDEENTKSGKEFHILPEKE